MIGEIALALTAALLSLPKPVALAAFSVSMLAPVVGCETVCMEWVSPFLSAALLGFAISIGSFVFGLNDYYVLILDLFLSAIIALLYAKSFLRKKLGEAADAVVVILILVSMIMAYTFPEATTQAMISLAGSLWTVDTQTALIMAISSVAIVLISVAYQAQLAAAMFDHEYLKIFGKSPTFWTWLLFFFLVFGTSYVSYALGLFTSQVLLILPAAVSLTAGLRELERSFEATYSVALASIIVGCWVSYVWGVPEVGVAGTILIISLVLLNLSKRIGKKLLVRSGSERGGHSKGDEQQKDEGGAVEESKRNS